jgi:signal transduction histidine kinase
MDAYKSGAPFDQLDPPVTEPGRDGDEIDRLVSAFKEMAGRIEDQVESLKKADSIRRELVANVSHDLRTPLATLQGYVETLSMKNSSLSPEERLNYLDIVMSHCKRLNKLVSDLFELAKLDAQETVPHREPFRMSELVQDVVQKFRLAAGEKSITIFTNIGNDLPFVSADIALIERVLENLMENALRHTPEDGTVSIVLSPEGDNLSVRISDTGHGIPETELPRIFDRFYQLDKSRKGKSGHSGLGLAISKRILELHGSDIKVDSVVDAGTTFTFILPVCRT